MRASTQRNHELGTRSAVRSHVPSLAGSYLGTLLALYIAVSLVPLPSLAADAGFSWVTEVVETGIYVSGSTALAIDSTGQPQIAFVDSATGLVARARRTGGAWGVTTLPRDGRAYGMVGMVLSPDDSAHLSYFDGERGFVKYARETESGWSISTVDQGYVEGHTSLAIDPTGFPHVAYPWDNGVLRHARWNGTTWIVETADRDVVIARFPSLVFDSLGRPRIAYHGNGMLRYARWIGYRWSVEVVDADAEAQFITLVLDAANLPRIAYRDPRLKELRFASWNGSAWNIEIVDSVGDVGWDARLALDALGNPHLSYYDSSLGRLKYASKRGEAWTTQVVDVAYLAGWYSSLAVDGDGRPHFSYYSWPDRSVKYAVGELGLGIRTWPATGVTHEAATLVGEATSLGNASEIDVFFEWRPTGGDWRPTGSETLTAPGLLRMRLEGLAEETTYEFRAVASAEGTLRHGDTFTFVTPKAPVPASIHPGVVVVGFAAAGATVALFLYYRTKRRGTKRSASEPARKTTH